jgi:transcriptional adapter 2-alpha
LTRKEKKRTKEEKEIYNNMRVFARFQTAEEHEEFVQGLINEQRLRKRIEQLQEQRLQGIRTLAEGEAYEADKKKRELALANAKRTLSGREFFDTGKRRLSSQDDIGRGKKGKTIDKSDQQELVVDKDKWSPVGLEGFDLLSSVEKQLCTELRLLPQHYMLIKERLIKECFTRGFLQPGQAKQLIRIDVNKTSKIFDFFVSVGWVNTQPIIPVSGEGENIRSATTTTDTSSYITHNPISSKS